MLEAIDIAREQGLGALQRLALSGLRGVGVAGVHRSTHFGCSSHYVMQVGPVRERAFLRGAGSGHAEPGWAETSPFDGWAEVFTNSSPALPPHGGGKALLGASPFAAGAPAGHGAPLVLDMSTTVIARGKLRLMHQRGEQIPEGVGLDRQGGPLG